MSFSSFSTRWLRRRVRDTVVFAYQVAYGRRFVARRMGLTYLFDLDNTVDRYLLAFGRYEEPQRATLFGEIARVSFSADNAAFVDVGAHSGIYALWAAQTGRFGRIFAIEADHRNVAHIHANLSLNRLTERIEVVAAAASDTRGTLSFALSGTRSRDVSKVAEIDPGAAGTTATVPCVPVEELVAMQGGFVALKIDVEGWEASVLRGMRTLLTSNRCLLQVEVFDRNRAEILGLMTDLGFSLVHEVGSDRYFRNY